ncbi:hypothetical protein EV182_002778 [Spiromyces aspiralis]|uniref:Uncharacterized protein n=1 Tax=Spiromyces aspiralis TaxID=68401 RepID=A0ACC1HDP8_9FUNG|nr:hypothetical protein EV182_002778 [Spiromyces aspiralis]
MLMRLYFLEGLVSQVIKEWSNGEAQYGIKFVYESLGDWCGKLAVAAAGGSKGRQTQSHLGEINVAILDSSFNPPHVCHQAYLECVSRTPLRRPACRASVGNSERVPIHGLIMLLGTLNCDKGLTGASLAQRLEMMEVMAKDICARATKHVDMGDDKGGHPAQACANIATGLCATPRFVDKAKHLREFITARAGKEGPEVNLYFMMGWDTLVRFFDPKYYSQYPDDVYPFFSGGGRIIFARRGGYSDAKVDEFIRESIPAPLLEYIYELKLPKNLALVSSTLARQAVRGRTNDVEIIPQGVQEIIARDGLYHC